ncbi:MAG: rane protein [Clostridia bacterium]|nr:rane protein [Clostridia bacterium]
MNDIVFILVIIAYAVWAVYDLVPLYKQKFMKDLWVNIILGTLSFTVGILLCFDIKIPSPEQPIREFITSLFEK